MPQSNFIVLTDSACDMPLDLEQSSGVEVMSFDITVDGKSYTERVDFTFDEYYDILRQCEGIPATAHITMPRFLAKFEECAAADVRQVLYVSINASGSATYNAAQSARDSFYKAHPDSPMKITILNSRTYSMAYGWFVAEAARKLRNGAEMGDVVAWLEEMFSKVDITLAAFTLKYMKKSGRISAAAAFAGELLGLRPIISLTDGVSTVQRKVRGDKEVYPAMMQLTKERMDDSMWYAVGGTNQQQIEELAAVCEKKWKVKPVTLFKLGAAVATNTGPDAIAIVYLAPSRDEVAQ